MAVKTIPVLPADYPLFNWDGHGDSRAALYQGGPVAAFRKETWNAMVDTVLDAMAEAGLSWDDAILPAASVKISEAYGALSAPMLNALAGNILQAVPIGGYGWAVKPEFRGYVGRNAFRGYATHGKDSDFVYPEYFVELARRLDLMLQVMRGDAPFADAAVESISGTALAAQAFNPLAAAVAGSELSESRLCGAAVIPEAAAAEGHAVSRSAALAGAACSRVGAAGFEGNARSMHAAPAHVTAVVRARLPGLLLGSRYDAAMTVGRQKAVPGGRHSVASASAAGIRAAPAIGMRFEGQAVASRYAAQAVAGVPRALQGGAAGQTGASASVERRRPRTAAGCGNAHAEGNGALRLTGSLAQGAVGASCSRNAAALDCAWQPPVLRDGILFIRSSYEAVLQDNVLEVI